jgi:hypothetical protein
MKRARKALILPLVSSLILPSSLIAASASLYSLTVLSNHPVAYWRLDESNGSLVAHDSAGGHDCVCTNVQLGLAGYNPTDSDSAAGFGLLALTNSYAGEMDNSGVGISNLDFSQPAGSNAEFSIEAWEKADLQDTNGAIIAKGYGNGGEQFDFDFGKAGGDLRFFVRDAGGNVHSAGSTMVPDGNWHHVVGVCDASNGAVHLYVDGADIVDGTIMVGAGLLATSGGPPGASRVSLGSRTSSKTSNFNLPFEGTIDEVAIYNYALNAGQVQADYQAGISTLPLFTNLMKLGTNLIFSGLGGGSNGPFTLLASTNLTLPLASWTAVAINTFDGSGRFNLTNPLNPAMKQQFYALQATPVTNDLWIPAAGAWLGAEVTNDATQAFSDQEAEIGRQLDVLRIYHTPGSWTTLTSEELSYINAGRKLLLSVKPSSQWSNAVGVANGGSATVDSQMTSLAQSIAAVKPAQIMLIVWHEPENDVIGPGLPGSAGTTTEYVEMWHNVRNIFDANGATNVIWCWDIENLAPAECSCSATYRALLPLLWPGNTNVDWVMWDPYCSSESITNDVADGYNWLIANSNSTNNYASKPFGLAEWGVGINSYYPTVAQQTNGINQMNVALNLNNQFPKLKLLAYYDDLASALLSGAILTYSNFANSPYMEQQP